MNLKVLLGALLVMVSVQGLYGELFELTDDKTIVDEHLKAILQSALDAISRLTERVSQFVEDALSNLNQIIATLLDEVKTVVTGATETVTSIIDRLNEILQGALTSGQISAECAAETKAAIQELLHEALANITTCPAAAGALVPALTQEVGDLVAAVNTLLAGATAEMHACVPVGNIGLVDIPGIAGCVSGKLNVLISTGRDLVGQITTSLAQAPQLVLGALASVKSCLLETKISVLSQAQQIHQSLTDCITNPTTQAAESLL